VRHGDPRGRRPRAEAKPGRELQVHCSGAAFQWLPDNELVDEMCLFTFPVPDGGPGRDGAHMLGRNTAAAGQGHCYPRLSQPPKL
jgi:hypothetical protein